jgi:biotin carboxylase
MNLAKEVMDMTEAKKLIMLLGGSLPYVRNIQAAQEAGLRVVVVDKQADAPGLKQADECVVLDIQDRQGVLDAALELNIDAIVPMNDFGVPTAAFVSSALGIPGIPESVAEAATKKAVMRRVWRNSGIPCPKVAHGTSKQEIVAAINEIGLPCILKPANGIGGGSRGVIVVRTPEEVVEAILFSTSFYDDKTTLVEEFISSKSEHSIEILIESGTPKVIAIGDKVKGPLPYRVDLSVTYPSKLSGIELEAVQTSAISAVQAIGLKSGAAHVELAMTERGPILFELGARGGGGATSSVIVPYVTGVQFFIELIRNLLGESSFDLEPQTLGACAYHFFVAPLGIIESISGMDEVLKHPAVIDGGLFLKPGDLVSKLQVGSDRAGFLVVTGNTPDEALDLARDFESKIDFIVRN